MAVVTVQVGVALGDHRRGCARYRADLVRAQTVAEQLRHPRMPEEVRVDALGDPSVGDRAS